MCSLSRTQGCGRSGDWLRTERATHHHCDPRNDTQPSVQASSSLHAKKPDPSGCDCVSACTLQLAAACGGALAVAVRPRADAAP
jgi:hypothetical protein